MGTYIDYCVEHKQKDGSWRMIKFPEWPKGLELDTKDYNLFSLLADVRSYGMIKKRIKYIEGIPFDISDSAKFCINYPDKYGLNYGHTCITLTEFLAFNFNQKWDGHKYEFLEDGLCSHCGGNVYTENEKIYTYADRFDALVKVIEWMNTLNENTENVRMLMSFND